MFFSVYELFCLFFWYRDLHQKFAFSDKEFEGWQQSAGLLFVQSVCLCGNRMTISTDRKKKGSVCRMRFRCTKRGCRKTIEFHVETFFEKGFLSIKEVFRLWYFFVQVHRPVYNQIALNMPCDTGSTASYGKYCYYPR